MTRKPFSPLSRRGALALAGGALAVPLVLRYADAAEVTLKLSHMLPSSAFAHRRLFQPWAEKVANESGGRIEVRIFPSMSLGGKPPELVNQVRDGIADLAWALPTYESGRFPLVETWTLPFMVTSAERTAQAIDAFMRTHGGAEWDSIRPLAWWCHGPGRIMTKGRRIARMEDLKGARIRGGNQVVVEALELLGANGQFYPVPELPFQVSRGTSDGVALPYEVVPALKLDRLFDHFAEPEKGARELHTLPFLFAMNRKAYESLPNDLRGVIDANSGPILSKQFGAEFDQADGLGRELIEKAAGRFTVIPAKEIARWRTATAPLVDKWIAELNKRDFDGKALVSAANALLDRHTRMQ